jgi:hypothetical protein
MKVGLIHLSWALTVWSIVGLGTIENVGCKQTDIPTVGGDVIQLTADACKLVEDSLGDATPDWVELICTDLTGVQRRVKMPAIQWEAMKTASVKAKQK